MHTADRRPGLLAASLLICALLACFATAAFADRASASGGGNRAPGLSQAIEATAPSGKFRLRCEEAIGDGAERAASSASRQRRVATRVRTCVHRLRRAAKRHSQARKLASASQSVPQIGPLVVGIDGGYGGWSQSEIQERTELGAAVTRHEWATSEPVNAQDNLVYTAAAVVHTRIHALLGDNELGDPTQFREFVVAFIRRYGAGGSFWAEHPELNASKYAMTTFELGNEPYFGGMTATEYANAVRPTLEEVKRLGLPAKIVLASRVYGNDTSWIETLYRQIPELNTMYYALAEHPYWYGHGPAQGTAAGPFARIATTRATMNSLGAGSKPIFVTEYGESTASCGGECVSEAVQAQHLSEMISGIASHPEWGVEMLSVYQLQDRGTESPDREIQFGLLRQNGTPKPAYAVVQSAMQQYRG